MRLGKTAFLHFGSQLVLSLAGFLATFVIARVLGSSVLGMYVTVVALLFWLKIPADGVASAVTKRASEGAESDRFVNAGILLNAAFVAVTAVIILGGSKYIEEYVGAPVSGTLILLLGANVFFDTVAASLQGQKKIVTEGYLRVSERIMRVALQVGFIFLAYRLTGLLVGHTLSLLTAGLIGLLLLNVRPTLPSTTSFKRLLNYGQYSWLGSLRGRMFGWMDTIVLALFVSSSLVGIYEVAWTLASTLILISRSVRQTLFPEFSGLGVDGEYDRIHHYLNEALLFTGIFAIPGFFGAAVLGPQILRIYRPEFMQGGTVLLLLIVARFLGAFGSQFRSAINAVDRPDIAFRINIVFVLTNLVLNVVLVYSIGWYGAAVATLFSAFVSLLLGYGYLVRLIGHPSLPYAAFGSELAAGLLMAVCLFLVEPYVPANHFATIGLVLTSAVFYGLVLVALSSRIRSKVFLLKSSIAA